MPKEEDYLPQVCAAWFKRIKELGLSEKSIVGQRDRDAYMQGMLSALTASGVMDMRRADMIGFLVMIGRGGEFMHDQASKVVKGE